MNRSGSMFKKGILQNLNLPFLIPNLLNFFFPSFKIDECMCKNHSSQSQLLPIKRVLMQHDLYLERSHLWFSQKSKQKKHCLPAEQRYAFGTHIKSITPTCI